MKKLHVLIPSLVATVGMPLISLVGCGGETPPTPPEPDPEIHNVIIDSSSDSTNITISTPQIILNQELVISYEITNAEKELDADSSWIKFDSSQLPLTNPEFSYDDNKVVIPADKVTTYEITICLKSKQIPPPVASDFNTDPWSTVGYYATKGINALTEAYSTWLSSHDNTFIGATRQVTFNTLTYDVMVIGTQEDYYDVDHSQPVALTFQFTELLSQKSGDGLRTVWAEQAIDVEDYWNTTIHNFLSKTIYPKIISENPQLEQYIKCVDRVVNTKIDGSWTPTHGNEYVFVPLKSDIRTLASEIAHYSWWKQHSTENDRIKKDKKGTIQCWWTASVDKDSWVSCISTSGVIVGYSGISTACVLPCFSI